MNLKAAELQKDTVRYCYIKERTSENIFSDVLGLPIDFVDPTEGNFSLTESVAVLDKEDGNSEKAMEMAQCIIEKGREKLQAYYPNALYEGETTDGKNKSTYPKVFSEPLTVDLLEQHQELSESCK